MSFKLGDKVLFKKKALQDFKVRYPGQMSRWKSNTVGTIIEESFESRSYHWQINSEAGSIFVNESHIQSSKGQIPLPFKGV